MIDFQPHRRFFVEQNHHDPIARRAVPLRWGFELSPIIPGKDVVKLDVEELKTVVQRSIQQAANLVEFPVEWQAEMRAKLAIACGQAVDNIPVGGSEAATVSAAESSEGGEASILLSGINDVTNMMMSDSGLSDIFVTVLESIYRGLGLNRVILLINDPANKQLVVRFGFAPDLAELKDLLKVSTDSFDANPGAPALYFGQLMSFSFEAEAAPIADTDAELGIFKPGTDTSVTGPTTGPQNTATGLADASSPAAAGLRLTNRPNPISKNRRIAILSEPRMVMCPWTNMRSSWFACGRDHDS